MHARSLVLIALIGCGGPAFTPTPEPTSTATTTTPTPMPSDTAASQSDTGSAEAQAPMPEDASPQPAATKDAGTPDAEAPPEPLDTCPSSVPGSTLRSSLIHFTPNVGCYQYSGTSSTDPTEFCCVSACPPPSTEIKAMACAICAGIGWTFGPIEVDVCQGAGQAGAGQTMFSCNAQTRSWCAQ